MKLETKRQMFHCFFGILIAISIYFLPVNISRILALSGTAISLAVSCHINTMSKISIIKWLLDKFEREKDLKEFPLKGVFFFMLGVTISIFLYPREIASAAVIALALGDSFSTIAGSRFNKTKLFYNKRKSLEGSIGGFIASFIGISFLYSLNIAFAGSLSFAIIESLDLKIKKTKINDNLLIPIICGGVIYLLV